MLTVVDVDAVPDRLPLPDHAALAACNGKFDQERDLGRASVDHSRVDEVAGGQTVNGGRQHNIAENPA